MKSNKIIFLVMVIYTVASIACEKIPQSGIIRNTSNGITTTFKNIKTEEVVKVMNGEVVEHDQVVLGENLEVISNKISGLTEKNGLVSVGCELTVSDQSGKVLLHLEDMFGPDQTFVKDSVSFLRCTVSTGSPMQYNEKYDVIIKYWDKF